MSVAFGTVCAGSVGHATLTICNTGVGPLSISGITSSNPTFWITPPSGGFPVTIAPGACFPIDVTFNPATVGPQTATLTIASDDPMNPSVGVQATATGGAGTLGLSPNQSFPPTVIQSVGMCHSQKPFVISNTGACNLTITNVAIGGANAGDYSLSGVPAFPMISAAGTHRRLRRLERRLRADGGGPRAHGKHRRDI